MCIKAAAADTVFHYTTIFWRRMNPVVEESIFQTRSFNWRARVLHSLTRNAWFLRNGFLFDLHTNDWVRLCVQDRRTYTTRQGYRLYLTKTCISKLYCSRLTFLPIAWEVLLCVEKLRRQRHRFFRCKLRKNQVRRKIFRRAFERWRLSDPCWRQHHLKKGGPSLH